MKRPLLDRLPASLELAFVVLVAFGPFLLGSLEAVLAPRARASAPINESSLASLIVVELVLGGIVVGGLLARGWSARRIGLLPITLRGTLIGLGLAVAAYAVDIAVSLAASAIPAVSAAFGPRPSLVAPGINLWTLLAVVVVNPLYEELFVCGYLIGRVPRPRDGLVPWSELPWGAINLSVAIRTAYHLYQGPIVVLDIIPFGLVMAIAFARGGRLWPIIVAHAVVDAAGLLPFLR